MADAFVLLPPLVQLLWEESRHPQGGGCLLHSVTHIVPSGKRYRIFRAVTDEDAKVVQPCGCEHNVIVVVQPFADQLG